MHAATHSYLPCRWGGLSHEVENLYALPLWVFWCFLCFWVFDLLSAFLLYLIIGGFFFFFQLPEAFRLWGDQCCLLLCSWRHKLLFPLVQCFWFFDLLSVSLLYLITVGFFLICQRPLGCGKISVVSYSIHRDTKHSPLHCIIFGYLSCCLSPCYT